MSIPDLIPKLILWGIVPLIIFSLLLYAARLATSPTTPKLRTSSIAGFWAGIVLALIYIISQLNRSIVPDFSLDYFPEFTLGPILAGALGGFALLAIVGQFSQYPVVGLLALVLSAASCSALFSYFFLPDMRDAVMYIALGTAFGALLYRVFSPMLEKT